MLTTTTSTTLVDTLAYLVSALVRLPPKLAASFVCETYNPLSDTYGWRGSFQDGSEGACHGFLAAYTGAGYRRSFFAADVLSDPVYNFTGAPDGCHVHDDVWISGNLFRRGIRPYVVGVQNGMWPQESHRPYNKLSINSVEDMKGQQKRCLKYFNYFMEAGAEAAGAA
ncbi:hypothetical protein TSOC_001926 [Tetrabaena socialis]|uniref:Uncharacterized protein n=1 Tax=Tetrabaena socialis TaxID=47790 RepID=A0A2J8AFD6_9CHLO|nr:hypothetical protein TSOC_001926 [Tetrabaena socialis]|eukprot:PNH11235.1 hypothetical protein TSOC_001926 [Tetrabaena socialis]